MASSFLSPEGLERGELKGWAALSKYNLMQSVSTMGGGELGKEIVLPAVLEALEGKYGIEATSQSGSMATIRLEEGGPAHTLYQTGTFQIRGPDTRESLFEAKDNLLSALEGIGLDLEEVSFEQQNAVFLEDFETEIQLEPLAITLGLNNIEYEPEQFPGVIYRPPEFGTVMLVFATGNSIISGTTSEETARQSVSHLRDELEELE